MEDYTDYIINSFYFREFSDINLIFGYVKNFIEKIDKKKLKLKLNNLMRKNILKIENNKYVLTNKGLVIMRDNFNYYSNIVRKFILKRCILKKKYNLIEYRTEQHRLRKFLIENKEHKCVICDKKLPLCLLETAHLKPRKDLMNIGELLDSNIVNFFCVYCHKLYDYGYISVEDGRLKVSESLKNWEDLNYEDGKAIYIFDDKNRIYFDYHMKIVFLGKN